MSLKLPFLLLVLLLHAKTSASHWLPHLPPSPPVVDTSPLCASQFALVNRACSMLPYTPIPSHPTSDDDEESESSHRRSRRHHGRIHGHGHSHSHRSHHRHKETPAEEECCRWLREVDNVCVCDLLVHLPPFLTRPVHNYTAVVDESCVVSFQCGSRLV